MTRPLRLIHPSPGQIRDLYGILYEQWGEGSSKGFFTECISVLSRDFVHFVLVDDVSGLTDADLRTRCESLDHHGILATASLCRRDGFLTSGDGNVAECVSSFGLLKRPQFGWCLSSVVVRKDLRGKGLGTELLEAVTRKLKEHNLRRDFIILWSSVGEWYSRWGWHYFPTQLHVFAAAQGATRETADQEARAVGAEWILCDTRNPHKLENPVFRELSRFDDERIKAELQHETAPTIIMKTQSYEYTQTLHQQMMFAAGKLPHASAGVRMGDSFLLWMFAPHSRSLEVTRLRHNGDLETCSKLLRLARLEATNLGAPTVKLLDVPPPLDLTSVEGFVEVSTAPVYRPAIKCDKHPAVNWKIRESYSWQ